MSVLILKNIASEGPGTIGDFLVRRNITFEIADLQKDGIGDADRYDTLVMMGGPMSVNDEEAYPYLTEEMSLARQFMKSGKKVLGICLGAQLMAKALGARVYPGAEKEIGWYDIELCDAGTDDPLMSVLEYGGSRCRVFQWHGETFDIPEGAVRLAGSELFRNQAFRYGKNSYALQFHVEVTKEMISDWLRNEPVDLKKIEQDSDAYYAGYSTRAEKFYESFFNA